ncbi:MAG: acetylglutamate kinase [Nitrospinota bacterium]|nr:acetylglutamate kinase [Nitrospinota bacterium]
MQDELFAVYTALMSELNLNELIGKAAVLIEALPYIRQYSGKTVVIKYGGSAMVEEGLKEGFARDVALLKLVGINPVVVHGGGPQIGKTLEKMGIPTRFVDGHRVSDGETIDVVEMVLVGKVNKEIVSLLSSEGGRAVGLSGKDGRLIEAEKMLIEKRTADVDRPEIIDIGMVGKVTKINKEILETIDKDNFIPVIAPVGVGSKGETYNINADTVAGEIAAALKAEKLVLLTDERGILGSDKELLSHLNESRVEELIEKGVIKGGMLPKVKSCFRALDAGVKKTHIIDGRVKHSVLLEIFTDKGIGTEIVR